MRSMNCKVLQVLCQGGCHLSELISFANAGSEVGKLVQNHPQKVTRFIKIHGKRMWKADHVQARHEIILEQCFFDVDALILDRSYITTTLCQSEWLIDVNCGILWGLPSSTTC